MVLQCQCYKRGFYGLCTVTSSIRLEEMNDCSEDGESGRARGDKQDEGNDQASVGGWLAERDKQASGSG